MVQEFTSILAVIVSIVSLVISKRALKNSKSFYKLRIDSHKEGLLTIQVIYTGDTLLRIEGYKLYCKYFNFLNKKVKHQQFNNYTFDPINRSIDIFQIPYEHDTSGIYPKLSKIVVYGSRSGENVKLNLRKQNNVEKEEEILIG